MAGAGVSHPQTWIVTGS